MTLILSFSCLEDSLEERTLLFNFLNFLRIDESEWLSRCFLFNEVAAEEFYHLTIVVLWRWNMIVTLLRAHQDLVRHSVKHIEELLLLKLIDTTSDKELYLGLHLDMKDEFRHYNTY